MPFSGTTNFIVLALLTSFLSGTWYLRQVLVTSLVVIWGLRLGLFLLFRILAWGEDHRFDQTRNNVLQFAIFWVFQAVWVWVVSLPVTIVNATVTRNPPLGPVDALGCALWAAGVLLEGAADQQKLRFKADAANRGHWCDVGVWSWSRHPNYCGEILAWVGVLVVSSAVLQGWQWVAVASPLFTATILLFLSGMPLLEESANKKFGQRADYLQYRANTSPLIPLPPGLYAMLPHFIKFAFFLELPIYAEHLSTARNSLIQDDQ
ncbi:unnamed protein product [Closterium sp. Naga37s-1]|nr:unnamed protein product [Closterium sp. Naga37s-1]